MGYLLPFDRSIKRSQDFGANPGWGPNPPGGHNGDDWATPVGTPVLAAGDGVVVFAGEFDDSYADNWGWNLHYGGLMVVLNMDGETAPYFEYGHTSKLLVKTGDRVKRGQVIALTGNTDGGTGISTGPHCHVGCLPYNFNLGTSTYGRVNPRLFMTDYPDNTGSLSYAGTTITPLPTEDDPLAAYSRDDLVQIAAEGYDKWAKDSRLFPGNRNVIDHLIQTRSEVGGVKEAVDSLPQAVLIDYRVEGRNFFDSIKQVRTDLFGTRSDGGVDVDALAASLAERLEAPDLASLAEKLQITVKESPNG